MSFYILTGMCGRFTKNYTWQQIQAVSSDRSGGELAHGSGRLRSALVTTLARCLTPKNKVLRRLIKKYTFLNQCIGPKDSL